MNPLTNLITGLKSLFFKRRVDRELDEELQSYLEASVADKQRSGLSRKAARYAARVEMGSQGSVKHQVWSSRWESTLDSLFKDIRFGIRGLAKRPGFTLVALLSLALGIGANTAIFTLINQVVLRNMPVREPSQLVIFGKGVTSGVLGGVDLGTYHMYTYDFARQLEANPGPFQGVAAYSSFAPRVSVRNPQSDSDPSANSGAAAIQVTASLVSGNYFSVLQASPLLGRTILPSDAELRGGSPVAVISYHYWQQQLSSDPSILGKTISINSNPFRVIGVMPAGFDGIKPDLEPPSIWTPLTMQQQIMVAPDMLAPRSTYFLHMFARLTDTSGRTVSPSSSTWKNAQLWLDQQIRTYIRAGEGAVISADRQQEINRATDPLFPGARGVSYLGARYGDTLNVLMVVVGLVLLIACANLANFLLARSVTRQREIATRLALGSSRSRIVRQSLIETLILSLTGGALGLATAFVATRTLIAFVAHGVAHTPLSPLPDLPVLLFTLGISLFTGLLFGLGPAIHSARASASLSSNARAVTGSRSTRLAPKILVTSQIMLSLLLLVGAGLFLRSLRNLESRDFGFERSHLLLADIAPTLSGRTSAQAPSLNQSLIERLEAIPGVRSVALAETPPVGSSKWNSAITIPGYVAQPKEDMSSTLNRVSPRYFETVGIPLVAGRPITAADSATSLKVCVINQALAKRFFPKGDAIGHSVSSNIDSVKGPWQIVGIARDTLSANPRDTASERMIYMPLAQMTGDERFAGTIQLRTSADPANAIADLRRAVAQVEPNLPIVQVHTIKEQIDGMMSEENLFSSLTGIFSALALVLAAIGLYGVMSYSVVRRTSEIGIRLALGAQTTTVLWMVLRESILLLVLGLALGLPLTLASTRYVRGQLYGLSALDPSTFAVAIAIVTVMTLIAAWLPARHASKVDPMVALRCD